MMIDFSSGGADITLRMVTETVWLRKSKKQRGIGTGDGADAVFCLLSAFLQRCV